MLPNFKSFRTFIPILAPSFLMLLFQKNKNKIRMKFAKDVLDLIGNTPLLRINKLVGKNDAIILAKLERQNIGGSLKDRIAKYMIEQAEKKGKLTKNKIILEPTSGNTGIGLAIVAAVKGYKVAFTMQESVSEERKKILRAFGAEIILTPKEKGTDGAIEVAYEMVKKNPKSILCLTSLIIQIML